MLSQLNNSKDLSTNLLLIKAAFSSIFSLFLNILSDSMSIDSSSQRCN